MANSPYDHRPEMASRTALRINSSCLVAKIYLLARGLPTGSGSLHIRRTNGKSPFQVKWRELLSTAAVGGDLSQNTLCFRMARFQFRFF